MSRPLVAILVCAALEASGIALIFPTLPHLLRAMAGTDNVSALYGTLLALHALTQFIVTPVLGVLSDRVGRRPVLLLALAGTTVDYLIMAFTPYLSLLFISRTIAGLTAAGVAMITATIADITPEGMRAHRFGLFHACFRSGFVIGPVIGGMLGDISLRAPFLAAAALSSANVLIALFVLPETHRTKHKPFAWRTLNPFAPLRWALTFRALIPLLSVFLLVSLVGQTYSTLWVLFVTDRFHWTATDIGISLGIFGALVALVQAFAIAPLTERLGERGTLLLGIGCEAIALLILAFAQAGWIAFALIPLIAFGGISAPALRALQSKAVDRERQGQLQGVVASFVSLAAILGPLAFGAIYALSRPDRTWLVWIIGVAIFAVTVPMVLTVPKRAIERE
ncbi:TCR/Tet family MFS transporter [Bradyrhizobium sp. GCM10027634]|uniref:TCR/Tet family MFS transporter n=1 Tax=unclassified Bradyrhizobium TaxID=2631580 RepID=UPI00263B78C8|nr:TCR/Tet family MFS transporter [Bradyrhizobium sp. WYCCWR 12677]MDN5005455.1 TCR/Tet family MFS transporter [Bradyrhizobium sp. WYCCWR 12677]